MRRFVCAYMHALITEGKPYEGDLSSGRFSAVPGVETTTPNPTVAKTLADELREERELRAVGSFEWAEDLVPGHRYLVLRVDDIEVASLHIAPLEAWEAAEDGLTIVTGIGHIPDVKRLRLRKNTPHIGMKDYERRCRGPQETPGEMIVRIVLHGEDDVEIDTVTLDEDKLIERLLEPGESIARRAERCLIETYGVETVRKVLARRRSGNSLAAPVCTSGLARLGITEDEDFLENPDSDSWDSIPWYLWDDIARERDADWMEFPDLLTGWVEKTYRD